MFKSILLTMGISMIYFSLANATDYYVSFSEGADSNSGLSQEAPFQTLTKLYNMSFGPGDRILFKSGDSWQGMFWLKGSGSSGNPIIVDRYGGGSKPIIDGDGYQAAILIYNNDYIEINNLELTNQASHLNESGGNKVLAGYGGSENDDGNGKNFRFGILVKADAHSLNHFRINNVDIHDIYPTPINTDNTHKGYGILFRSESDPGINDINLISDITIENCYIAETGHYGLWIQGRGLEGYDQYKNTHIIVRDNVFSYTGGSGFVSSRAEDLLIEGCIFDNTGSSIDSRMWKRGSGYWAFDSKDVIVQENQFLNAHGPKDSYGAHIDFGNENVVFQYNYSYNNEGGFVEILGDNVNCGYRYNISVNDGWRIDPAGTPWRFKGKIFWVSNFCGGGNPGCPNTGSFIYNNTVYVPNHLNPEIYADDQTGDTHIFNNLIYVQAGGDVLATLFSNNQNTFFISNNLYYKETSFDFDDDLTTNAFYCNPFLISPGGSGVNNYRLGIGSPALGAGFLINGSLNTTDYLANNGGRDYFGNAVSSTMAPNIGAYNGPGITNGVSVLYEAEEATLSGNAAVSDCASMSNCQHVSGLGGSSGSNAATFNVSVASAGYYELTVSYLTTSPRTMGIEVNGVPQVYNIPSTGLWCFEGGSPGDFTTTVNLNGGGNTIKIFDAPQLDKIEVSINTVSPPLPVVLTTFSGRYTDSGVELNWVTSSERNNQGFEIEYSANAKDWTNIGFVEAHREIASQNHYDFIHPNPRPGINYYRLKQVDFDNAFDYSNIISVIAREQKGIALFPNPTSGQISITGINNGSYRIFDTRGKIQKESAFRERDPDISDLANGIYFIQLQSVDQFTIHKIIKY